jgi:preprotein translocase subunit YajC
MAWLLAIAIILLLGINIFLSLENERLKKIAGIDRRSFNNFKEGDTVLIDGKFISKINKANHHSKTFRCQWNGEEVEINPKRLSKLN